MGARVVTIWLPGVQPKTSHHAKTIIRVRARGRFVARLADKPDLVKAKATLDQQLAPYRPEAPMRGPVRLSLAWIWPWVQSDRLTVKRHATNGRTWHDRKPDCSNLTKTIEDRLVGMGFLEDDGQVVLLEARKYRGDTPGLWIRIEPAPAERWEL